MIKTKLLLAVSLLILSFSACKDNAAEKPEDKYTRKDPQTADNYILYTGKEMYDDISAGTEKSQVFFINKVSREGDFLVVSVTHSIACSNPKFQICWNGMIAMIYPMRIGLAMKLDDPACESFLAAVKTSEIRIDLKKHIGSFAADKKTQFSVFNAYNKTVVDFFPLSE